MLIMSVAGEELEGVEADVRASMAVVGAEGEAVLGGKGEIRGCGMLAGGGADGGGGGGGGGGGCGLTGLLAGAPPAGCGHQFMLVVGWGTSIIGASTWR